jgi:diguanylate cyclase (GGDEF)-like protein
MSIPFMLFFHDYLQDDNPYLCPILISASLVQSLVVLILHFTKIAYMRETLLSTHIMMAVALGYLIITFCRTLRKHKLRSQVRVSAVGMSVLSIAFIADMVAYSYHVNDSDMFGRIGFFIFILVLGVDATAASQREIEAGRKAMLYKELAEKDMLTNCYNRNSYLDDISGDKLEDGLLLVTFDLNNLKYYNDTFGHACGDQYLMDSATIMQEVFGSIGKLYRIGGDEFCVLIEPKTRCDIKQLLDEFIRQQERYNELPGQIHLQIACGYAQYHADSDADLEATRERADIRMYENKRALKGCEPR